MKLPFIDLTSVPVFAAGALPDGASGTWVAMLIALLALSAMEIVLGIDNIIFISIATGKLPKEQQKRARLIGLGLAMGFRILLLCFIATVASWTKPLFLLDPWLPSALLTALGDSSEVNEVSVRDLFYLVAVCS